jgi:hypothetical protein
MSKRPILCQGCGVILKVIETEVETDGFMKPTVFSCANCGQLLGIAPYACDIEGSVGDIHSAVSLLRQEIAALLPAASSKKTKKSK